MITCVNFDFICIVDAHLNSIKNICTLEFFNTITSFRLPNYELMLKTGVPVTLLHNID